MKHRPDLNLLIEFERGSGMGFMVLGFMALGSMALGSMELGSMVWVFEVLHCFNGF